MDRYQETFETWNKVAVLYQEKFIDLDIYHESYDYLSESLIKENACILDIGCGPGNISKYLLNKRPDFQILGLDIAPNMIALAKLNNPKASFDVMDIRQIFKLQSKFDGIVCGFCLPYLSQMECDKLISDASNLLNEEGMIYLSFVEGHPDHSDYQVGSSGDRVYFYFHTLEEIIKNLGRNAFVLMKIFKVEFKRTENQSEWHTILMARKKFILA